MAKKVTAREPDDFDVLVPLSKLLGLLDAAQKVDELAGEMDQLREQQRLLRGQFVEVMEKIRDLE